MVSVGAGAAVLSQAGPAHADKANDKIVMAVIGLGGRGRDHGRMFAQRDDVEIAYVCDPDQERIGSYPEQIGRIQGGKDPKGVQDLRRVLEDPDVDAVCIAACDHWHGPATVWACQAGKDVYVEKPCSHNIWEGRKMVEAARKYDRVVQVGTQNRSAPYIQSAAQYIKEGNLGSVHLVKVYNMKGGGPFIVPADSTAPPTLDYDLYLGPAPKRPFNNGHFHIGWKKFWAYSGGDMSDDGFHQLDIARLLIGDPACPKAVNAMGGRVTFQDDAEVPDTQVVSYEYDGCLMTFELTEWASYMMKTSGEVRDNDLFPDWPQNATRIEVYGTKAMMYVGRHGGGWQALKGNGKVVDQAFGRQETDEHHQDFVNCVRSRNRPNADIEAGHHSAMLCHLGNLGCRLGGRRLLFDPTSERIVNDDEANANELVRRVYREPYGIPEVV